MPVDSKILDRNKNSSVVLDLAKDVGFKESSVEVMIGLYFEESNEENDIEENNLFDEEG